MKSQNVCVAVIGVLFLCASHAQAQRLSLGVGVKGIRSAYETPGKGDQIFWQGESIMIGASLACHDNHEAQPLPLVWQNKRWHAFLMFDLDKYEEPPTNKDGKRKTPWIPVPKAIKFGAKKETTHLTQFTGGPEKPPISLPSVLPPGKSAQVDIELFPGEGLEPGLYRCRAALYGLNTPENKPLISPWFTFEVRVIKDLKDRLAALSHQGYRFWFAEKLDEAEQVFKQMLQLYPQSIEGHLGLGDIYLKQGKYTQAEQLYKKAEQFLLAKQDEYSDTCKRQDLLDQARAGIGRRIIRCQEMRKK